MGQTELWGEELENWLVFGKYNKVQFWVIFGKSWGGACLVGEMFLYPVGVFLTYLEAPSSHIRKNQTTNICLNICII